MKKQIISVVTVLCCTWTQFTPCLQTTFAVEAEKLEIIK